MLTVEVETVSQEKSGALCGKDLETRIKEAPKTIKIPMARSRLCIDLVLIFTQETLL